MPDSFTHGPIFYGFYPPWRTEPALPGSEQGFYDHWLLSAAARKAERSTNHRETRTMLFTPAFWSKRFVPNLGRAGSSIKMPPWRLFFRSLSSMSGAAF